MNHSNKSPANQVGAAGEDTEPSDPRPSEETHDVDIGEAIPVEVDESSDDFEGDAFGTLQFLESAPDGGQAKAPVGPEDELSVAESAEVGNSDASEPSGSATEDSVSEDSVSEDSVSEDSLLAKSVPNSNESESLAKLDAISDALSGVSRRISVLESLQQEIDPSLRQVERRVEGLSKDAQVQSKQTLLKDMVGLHDLAVSMATTTDDRDQIPVSEFRNRILLVAGQLAQLLELHGLSVIRAREGDAFDAQQHFAQSGVACDSPEMHHTVKHVHQVGFSSESFVFRPAQVDVWVYSSEHAAAKKPPADESPEDESLADEKDPGQTSDESSATSSGESIDHESTEIQPTQESVEDEAQNG